MIALEDIIYKVFAAMVPLYVALILGYGWVRWRPVFTAEHCEGINRMVCYFILPLYGFELITATAHLFEMDYSVFAADAISKFLAVLMLAMCAKYSSRVDHSWCITAFSMVTLNSMSVGEPTMRSLYGQVGEDLAVQSSVAQNILWFPLLSCFLECRKMRMDVSPRRVTADDPAPNERDIEGTTEAVETDKTRPRLWTAMKIVGLKLALNPHILSSVVAVAWAVIAHRFKVKMPDTVKEHIHLLSGAGVGTTTMFNIGIFIATQKKVIAGGIKVTILGMVLRFIAGSALMAVSSLVVGLHGQFVLRIAIVQAALPQSITTFVFAKEYGLHANVLGTAVGFGTSASLPLLIAYYAALEVMLGEKH